MWLAPVGEWSVLMVFVIGGDLHRRCGGGFGGCSGY
jgi:hypothetical protein